MKVLAYSQLKTCMHVNSKMKYSNANKDNTILLMFHSCY